MKHLNKKKLCLQLQGASNQILKQLQRVCEYGNVALEKTKYGWNEHITLISHVSNAVSSWFEPFSMAATTDQRLNY